jgi:hypothetical protein
LQVEIRSRINGLDGKIEIVKAAINGQERQSVEEKGPLLESLGAFQALKERRDALIHARASEVFNGIARTFERRGAVYEVILTTAAVRLLNDHLQIYQKEIAGVSGVTGGHTPMGRAFRKSEGTGQLAEQAHQSYLATVRDCLLRRKALPPLPEFPQGAPTQPPGVIQPKQLARRDGGSQK